MLSIIIPTLNEEGTVEILLDSIKAQESKDYEIIIADAGSTDRTIEIAKEYGAMVTGGGHPGKGRNEGAKVARGDTLLFLDADAALPEKFLSRFLEGIKDRKLHIASCSMKIQERGFVYRFGEFLWNSYFWITQRFYAHGTNCIYATKEIHERLHGFDEKIKFGEEMDYIRRGSKMEKFGFIWGVHFLASARRFKKEGVLRTFAKYFFAEFLQIFGGRVRFNLFTYEGDKDNKKENE